MTLLPWSVGLPLLLVTWTASVKIKENVIFHKTNEIQTTRSFWSLSLVVDLLPYDTLLDKMLDSINEVYSTLDNYIDYCKNVTVCRSFIRLSDLRNSVKMINLSRQSSEESFYSYKPIMRHKRSLIPIVGDVMSSLFGVTSESDLHNIRNSIKKLSDNQMTLTHVVKKGLTALNLTRTEIWENREKINSIITQLGDLTYKIYSRFRKVEREIDKLAEYFNLIVRGQTLINRLGFVMQNIALAIENYKMHINFFSKNQITPSILAPEKLREILVEIQEKLPINLGLPADPKTELFKFYRMLKCTTIIWERKIIALTKIPLMDTKHKFEIYKIISIPIPKGNSELDGTNNDMLAYYDIEGKGIAINVEQTRYAILGDQALEHCSQPLMGYCEIKSAFHWVGTSNECVVALFVQNKAKIKKLCKTMIKPKVKLPKATYISNGLWIVITGSPMTFTEVCKEKETAKNTLIKTEPPVSFLNLTKSCYATSDYLILNPYFKEESKFLVKHEMMKPLELFNVTKIKIWEPLNRRKQEFDNIEIPEKLKRMDEIPMNDLLNELDSIKKVQTDVPWHVGLSSLGGVIIIAIIMGIISWRFKLLSKTRKLIMREKEPRRRPNSIELTKFDEHLEAIERDALMKGVQTKIQEFELLDLPKATIEDQAEISLKLPKACKRPSITTPTPGKTVLN